MTFTPIAGVDIRANDRNAFPCLARHGVRFRNIRPDFSKVTLITLACVPTLDTLCITFDHISIHFCPVPHPRTSAQFPHAASSPVRTNALLNEARSQSLRQTGGTCQASVQIEGDHCLRYQFGAVVPWHHVMPFFLSINYDDIIPAVYPSPGPNPHPRKWHTTSRPHLPPSSPLPF